MTDYEKYLVRKPIRPANGAMTLLSSKQVPESKYYIEAAWITGIPSPNPSKKEHAHDYDEIVIFWGGDYKMPQVLGAEIEYYIGGQPILFNTTAGFYIPAGTPHGSVTWKKYTAPHMRMTMMCGSGSYSESKNKPSAKKDFDYEQYAIRSPMREAGAEFVRGRTAPTMTYMSGVQIPGVKYYIEFGWTFDMPLTKTAGKGMPEMAHKNFEEIVLHIGGDPANPEDLGGDMEFYIGGQPFTFDTTAVVYVPRGMHHGPLHLKEYRKPHIVMAIMCGAGNSKEGWGESFIIDKGKEVKL